MMKTNLLVLLLGWVYVVSAQNTDSLSYCPIAEEMPYQRGEKLVFRVHYGFMNAAEAELTVGKDCVYNEDSVYHVRGYGKTLSIFNWFYKVEDLYESYIDQQELSPLHHKRRVNEGGHVINRDIDFNLDSNQAIVSGKQYKVPEKAQDLISAFYYARCIDFSEAKLGQEFDINTFFDFEVYPMKIRYLGKELVETSLGEFKCLKFRPIVQEGRVFKEEEDMTIWISDDECKVPIRVQTEILVGSIKMDLKSYSGLVGSLNEVEDD